MGVFVSVVSHGHGQMINKLECISSLIVDFHVVIKSNTPGDRFGDFNDRPNFHWIDHSYDSGFGENNNIVFNYCSAKLGMSNEDYFIVLNPDVLVTSFNINKLISFMDTDQVQIAAINLYKNSELTQYDSSVRNFPSLSNFISSLCGLGNTSVLDRSHLQEPCIVDWAAGSFLAFRSGHYEALGGFDEKYFMYCEDIDICYRSASLGERLKYYPQINAVHYAAHRNRKIYSKHFVWHLFSAFRFLLSKQGLTTPRTSLVSLMNRL
jgi:GT2 family glycosyltransferase